MSKLLKVQFNLARENLLKDLEGMSVEKLDVQPANFNNTIHWHIGHILLATEKFLFRKSADLPDSYGELFGFGSKPSTWQGEVPTVETLVEQLHSQLQRIKDIPDERFDEKLAKPVMGRETYGELAALSAYHESYHIGQIHAMKLLVD